MRTPHGALVAAILAAAAASLSASSLTAQFNWSYLVNGEDNLKTYRASDSGSMPVGEGGGLSVSQVCHPGLSLGPGDTCAAVGYNTLPAPSLFTFVAAPPGTKALCNIPDPSCDAGYESQVSGTLDYYYAITGGATESPVPVQLSGQLSFDFEGSLNGAPIPYSPAIGPAQVHVIFQGRNGTESVASLFANGAKGFTLNVEAVPGTPYLIELFAGADIDNPEGAFHNASTFTLTMSIDPVVQFAPGFDSTGYGIQLSPGLGNSTAPEPATAGALPAAFALLLLARRKRMRLKI